MTTTLTRTRPVELDPQRIHKDWLRPGLFGIVAAMSADGLWTFRHAAGAWSGEYMPTGDQVTGKTMNAVRAQAARPATLERFRDRAAQDVAAGPHRRVRAFGLARRRLDILDGRLVADWHPDGLCACGRYLVGDIHLDACPQCVDRAPGLRIRCTRLVAHRACPTVDPVRCEHRGCSGRAQPAPCWTGDRQCCGCCDNR